MSNIIDSVQLSGVTYTLSAQSSGGNPTVELTQAEYDALVSAGTVSADTYYIITDASPYPFTIDPTLDSGSTNPVANSAITTALNGKVEITTFNNVMDSMERAIYSKQPKLSAGTGIAISSSDVISVSGMQPTLSAGTGISIDANNVISVTGGGGGGGVEYSAGTNINITNHVISSTVPISGGGGTDSIIQGSNTTASGAYTHAEGMTTTAIGVGSHVEGVDSYSNGQFSHAEGAETTAGGNFSHTEGVGTVANNMGEHAEGWYNLSATGNTDSSITLFSVGNGTSSNARHNALEIRKNGDIYCNNGTADVKLQDYIQFKVVQITQAAYDALVAGGTVDSSTIYYIVN